MAPQHWDDLIEKALAGDAPPGQALLAVVDRASGRFTADEGQHLDFKQVVQLTDERATGELSKDILGFSNTGGGVILAGVADDGTIDGHPAIDTRRVREATGPWIGIRIDYEVGNQDVAVRGRNMNVGYVLVRTTYRGHRACCARMRS